jgi:hypothetical protein
MRSALAFIRSIATVAAFAGGALGLATSGASSAHADTAERCDAYSCAYIHCNWTGDRCYRVDEDRYRPADRYNDRHYGYRGYYDGYRRSYSNYGYDWRDLPYSPNAYESDTYDRRSYYGDGDDDDNDD